MSSDAPRFCARQGTLVGMTHWLPTEPFDYDWGRIHPVIGCDHILCSRCGKTVTVTPATTYSREYACACWQYTAGDPTSLAQDDQYRGLAAMESPPPQSWACGGHPALELPFELDGIHVDQAHFVEVARAGFTAPPLVPPRTVGHAFWVSRLYWVLPASHRPALGEAVATLVADADPVVAVRAMRFFNEQTGAPGSEKLAAIARDHGARFASTPDPDYPKYMMEDELLSALESRAFRRDGTGDQDAHEILRRAVLAGKNPNDVLTTFALREPDWLAAHAVEIVASAPKLASNVVGLLKKLPNDTRDNVYRRLANIDPSTRAVVRERVQAEFAGDERDRILARFDA